MPCWRAWSSSTCVPSTSVRMNSAGPMIERSTCVSAAKLTIASAPVGSTRNGASVGDVALVEVVLDPLEIRPVAGVGELVEHGDLVAGPDEPADELRADEARSAGDEHTHAREGTFPRVKRRVVTVAVVAAAIALFAWEWAAAPRVQVSDAVEQQLGSARGKLYLGETFEGLPLRRVDPFLYSDCLPGRPHVRPCTSVRVADGPGDRHGRRPGQAREEAVCAESAEALAQALAPVRQLRGALLAAQHRVRGARRARAELGSRDPADARREACLLEDRLGEVGPRAVAGRRHVVDAERQLEHAVRRVCEVADVGG